MSAVDILIAKGILSRARESGASVEVDDASTSASDLPYSHISLRITPPQQLAPVVLNKELKLAVAGLTRLQRLAQEESEEKIVPYHTQSSPPYTTLRTSIYVATGNGDEEGVEPHILEVDFEPQK
ncbi:hypothetical protein ARMGADRAFT_1063237 [Armillaria gallica]|uniref:Uncharacterized protein n=1 Tax=Armillaria gallica TaxID=47427 RepID=A0A2H3DVH3_ARMGA|nr:hypothetical protein ARMGADRAFT_1063237 [Armillaria gallica]